MKKGRLNILILLILFGCTQQSNKNKGEFHAENISLSPAVFTIHPDSLKVFTPGKKGFPKPIVKKANHSNTLVLSGPRKVIPGISYLKQSKEDIANGAKAPSSKRPEKFILNEKPIINTPGENGIEEPVVYVIAKPVEIELSDIRNFRKYIMENKLYSIQNKDTILPPLVVAAKYSPPIKANPPSFKDNSILDIKYLDIAHGLPSSNIYSILESKSGDIWMGSHGEGIARYDGNTLIRYGTEQGLNHEMVEEIIEDKKGNIWIATSGNGVACFDGEKFTWYTTEQGLPSNTAWTIHETKNGDIWIGTPDGLSKFDSRYFINYTTNQGLLTNGVRKISEDLQNNIWLGSQDLTMFDGEKFTIYPKTVFSTSYFTRIKEDSRGKLWVGTLDNGIFCFEGDTISHYSIEQGFTKALIYDIYEDSKQNLWFATYKDGLYKYDGNVLPLGKAGFTNYTEDYGLSHNTIIDITEDSDGNLLLATTEGGISIFNPNGFSHITQDQGLLFNKVNTIKEDTDHTIWFAGWGGGLINIKGDSITHFTQKEGLFNDWIYDISFDPAGNIWTTTEYGAQIGLSYFDHNTFTNYQFAGYYSDPVLPHILFISTAVDADGNIWFGTSQNGLLKFNNDSAKPTFTQYVFKELEGVPIRALYVDQHNNLWIGTEGNGFYIYDGIDFRNYTVENGLVGTEVNSFYESKTGDMWIASQSGLSRFDKNSNFTNYTTDNGLINNDVKSIVQDNHSNYWITTRKGISLMTTDHEEFYNFNRQDGLKGVDFTPKSGMIDYQNTIWWGNGKAITTLDLNTFEIPGKAPKIKISQVHINGKNYDYRKLLTSDNDTLGFQFTAVLPFGNIPGNLELEYQNHHLTFYFNTTDWQAPHQLKYQYILEGEDKEWSELTDQNNVIFGNLPYGNFTFKVKAIGAANKWSKTVEYPFVIYPPWWHTWWARAIYGLLFILLIILLVHLRTRSLHKRQKLLQKSEEKYRGVFDSITDVFLRTEIDGSCILISPSIFNVLGYTIEEVMGKNLSIFYTNPADRDKLIQKLNKKGSLQNFEVELTKKDGSIITGSVNTRFIFDNGGNPRYIESVLRDVTEQKKAEEKLRSSEQSLQKAQSLAKLGNWSWKMESDTVTWSKMLYNILGLDPKKSPPNFFKEHEQLMDKESWSKLTHAVERTSQFGEPYELTLNYFHKDGHTVIVLTRGEAVKNELGQVVGLHGTLQDITNRMLTEKKLQESEEKFRTLVTNTEEIVYMLDKDGTFLLSEGKGLEKLGLKGGEVVGMSVFELYKDFPEILEKIRQAFNGETIIMEHEFGDNYFKSWYTPHLNQSGEIIGLLGLSINITEQKKVELQILEYQKRLKKLAIDLTLAEEKTRKQIAGDLHDHVGQLLTSSRMQLSTINFEMDKDGFSKKINNISKALLQATQATREAIFNLSPPQLHEIGLYAAIHDWMKEQVELKYGIKTTISGNKESYNLEENTRYLLFRSVSELMINVYKHARAAHLNVDLKKKKDVLEIVVQDDGIGFDYNAKLLKLKNKSFGLFSIQERISDLGGAMKINSTPGYGTEIKLSIPLKE